MFYAIFCRCSALLRLCLIFFAVAVNASETVCVTVLASADLHGRSHILQSSVAPVVAREKSLAPGRVIYVDTGDAAQGSFAVNRQRGAGMLKMLSDAGCTLFVPGNHELEYGFRAFKALIREFPGQVLAANLHAPELAGNFADFTIVELGSFRIAFVGLMLQNMNSACLVEEARFQTLPGKAVLRKCVRKLRSENVDAIVLLRHAGKFGGGENLHSLIKNVPEIDLVIGAHTHSGEAGCRIGNAWFVQPPSHGKALCRVKLIFDRKSRRLIDIRSDLINFPDDPEIPDPAELDAVSPFTGENMNFPAEKMRKFCRTDLAMYAVSDPGALRNLLQNKNPLMRDCFRVFPYYDPVITVNVTAAELHVMVAEYLKLLHKRKQFLAVSGFKFDSARGRLHDIIFDKAKPRYTLAISAYAAAGAGGYLPDTRRIIQKNADYSSTENAVGILDIITSGKVAGL